MLINVLLKPDISAFQNSIQINWLMCTQCNNMNHVNEQAGKQAG